MGKKLPFIRRALIVTINKLIPYISLSDKTYLRIKYYLMMGKRLNLDNPETFNEKLQWLKLYGRRPIDTILSDKYAVKEYIAKTIGADYVIPLIGVWDTFDDIDFKKMPDKFVLKCTHDSGGIVICKDKNEFDVNAARKIFEHSLKTDYYVYSREKAYKGIPRRIIAEEYKEDGETKELRDYKFFCFNGEVKFFKIDFGRFTDHHANYYSPEGELLDLVETSYPPNPQANISLPCSLKKMVELANLLSKEIPFVRVDFYEVSGKVYFGEFTFSPAGGMTPFEPEEWDRRIGEWVVLPDNQRINK